MSEENQYWRCVIEALQGVMTIAKLAEEVGVDDRQVWRWKAGERIPRGLFAIKLHALHVKLCPERQCLVGHVAIEK